MVRVLHVFRIMNRGGAETMLMNIYRKIDREKIQFDFMCMDDHIGQYEEEIKLMGGKIYKISNPSEVSIIKHIKEIRNVMKNHGPYNVVHVHTLLHCGLVCFAAYLEKIPIRIAHAHSSSDSKGISVTRYLYVNMMKLLISIFATQKIACGKKAGKFLYGKSKYLILNNGIDLDLYKNDVEITKSLKKDLEIKDNEFVIGHIGRFVEVKNHNFFIKLAENLKNKNIKFKILLIGDGELKDKFKSNVRHQKLEKYFILTGVREDIHTIINVLDVFVMPSLYEGFPVTVIEAYAAGKRCVVSDTISSEIGLFDHMIDFVSLSSDIEVWIEKIFKEEKEEINIEVIHDKLKDLGFSSLESANILSKIYLKEEIKI